MVCKKGKQYSEIENNIFLIILMGLISRNWVSVSLSTYNFKSETGNL